MNTFAFTLRRTRVALTRPAARRPKCWAALCVVATFVGVSPAVAQDVPADAGFEVLDRGPIHEAFAEPVVDPALAAEQQAIVPREPPEPINELPPEVRPEGANVQWIPGYWMWSAAQEDFVWVSGVWRDAPPGRRWVPGEWMRVDGGFAWSPGFWINEDQAEIAFLPAPPDALEQGPSSPAPSNDHFWIPGCWIYQNQAYAWRPGYWYAGQPGWVWTPAYYATTPVGYVYIPGYWDRPLVSRGFLYASVYWHTPLYSRAGFYYRPQAVINTSLLIANLFVNPYHHHYYYGGFGPGYSSLGYYSWFAYHNRGPRYYDPLFAYHHWHDGHRRNDWLVDMQRRYDRFEHWDDRPGDRGNHATRIRHGKQSDLVLSSHRQLASHGVRTKVRNMAPDEILRTRASVADWRQLQQQRGNMHKDVVARRGTTNAGGEPGQQRRVQLGDDPGLRARGLDPRNGQTAVAQDQRQRQNIQTTGPNASTRAVDRTRVGRAALYDGAQNNGPANGGSPRTTVRRDVIPGAASGTERRAVRNPRTANDAGSSTGGTPRVQYAPTPRLGSKSLDRGAGPSTGAPITGNRRVYGGQPAATPQATIRQQGGGGAPQIQTQQRYVPGARGNFGTQNLQPQVQRRNFTPQQDGGNAGPRIQMQPQVRSIPSNAGSAGQIRQMPNGRAFNRTNTPGGGNTGGGAPAIQRSNSGGGNATIRGNIGGGGGGSSNRASSGGGGRGRGGRGR